jgi:LacI family transcriptional regulator
MAMQVYGSLARSGLAVGQDIGVASFDNQMPIANNLSPGLSTVALPYYEMGRLAMKLACQNTENSDGIIRLFGKLEERSSF